MFFLEAHSRTWQVLVKPLSLPTSLTRNIDWESFGALLTVEGVQPAAGRPRRKQELAYMNFYLQETSRDWKCLNLGTAKNSDNIRQEQLLPALSKPLPCGLAPGLSSSVGIIACQLCICPIIFAQALAAFLPFYHISLLWAITIPYTK